MMEKKKTGTLKAVLTVVTIAAVAFLMFTGNIGVAYGDTAFTIQADFSADATIEYDAVESLRYREDVAVGRRTNGFGSMRLAMGAYRNDEFGDYTRYTYAACPACVVLTVDGRILVVNGADAAATLQIYEELAARVGAEALA